MTFGRKPRWRIAGEARIDRLRQANHLERAGPVRQPPDEAALLERGDEPVDAGLRPEVERVLHLVEGGRDAALLQPLVDEQQQFELLARQHRLGLALLT